MSSFDRPVQDEFSGFDPERSSGYSREKIYGQLGDLNHVTSVRNGAGTTNVQPWMSMAINQVVGERKDLWKSQSAFIRDAIYHRLRDVQEYEWTTPETLNKLREGLSHLSLSELRSQEAHYQATYDELSDMLRILRSPEARRSLRERALVCAMDCQDTFWASEFKKIAEQA